MSARGQNEIEDDHAQSLDSSRRLLCLPAALAAAQDQDFSKVQMKVSKVAGNVYMLEGAGGNIGASVGDDGIVIVDDQYAPLADKIQAALKGITDKPVRFIINTHYHPDHTGGNAYFQKQAPIIAQDNVRKRLESGGGGGNGGSIHMEIKPAPHEALPIITFDHDVTVHLNGEDIRALYFPPDTPTATRSSSSRTPMSCTWATTSSPTAFPSLTWRAAAASMA